MASSRSGQRSFAVVLVAALGAACGVFVAGERARACSCAPDQWGLGLRSVTSDSAGVSHAAYWPSVATLMAHPGYASISTFHDPGQVHHVRAEP